MGRRGHVRAGDRGRDRRVETFYRDWKAADGLLIARRQETRTEGEKKVHLLTVETVVVNPPIEDSRFALPSATPAGAAGEGGGSGKPVGGKGSKK